MLAGTYFILTIEDDPKVSGDIGEISDVDVDRARLFVTCNKSRLLQHWNDVEVPLDAWQKV